MLATTYALACLVMTGLLDLVFKFYSNGRNSRGLMMAGVGLIWFALQCLYMVANDLPPGTDSTTLLFGSVAALLLVTSNILLLESLGRLPVSIASTIYRLNTVPLLLMAVVFLGEEPGLAGLSGIGFGLLSVYLLYARVTHEPLQAQVVLHWFILVIIASCIRALYGIVSKAGLSQGAAAESMMLLAAIGWFTGGVLHMRFIDSTRRTEGKAAWLIVAAGVLVFSIVWFLTTALSLADAVSIMPIANLGFVAAFIFAVVFRLESLTPRKLLAIVVAVISVSLITYAG